ncbi:MAG: hypothetical protein DI537_39780 [Stutzerimonas stutzeri]|nr:MAG: hypothetical protein DI537_39780 [Stutzerimonas stutzeri]
MSKVAKPGSRPGSYEVPLQFDFFESDGRGVTQTIALWDVAPRGVYRVGADLAPDAGVRVIKRTFNYGGMTYNLALTPAILERDGVSVTKYPSDREQLVEEVVRQIAVQRGRMHRDDNGDIGVSFSMYQVFKELIRTGHRLNYAEIREALMVLHSSKIEIWRAAPKAKEVLVSGTTFPMLALAGEDSESEITVTFNWLIAKAIMTLNFRQMDYELLMSLPGPIERWLYRFFAHEMLYLGKDSDERVFTASDIAESCGVVKRSRIRDTFRRITQALGGLKTSGILAEVSARPVKEGKRIVEVEYRVRLSAKFVRSLRDADQAALRMREDFKVITGQDPDAFVPSSPERRKALRDRRREHATSLSIAT